MPSNTSFSINVKVKPNSKFNKIEFKNQKYTIYVSDPPKKGKANKKIIKLLSDYFSISKSAINIKSGITNKNKIIEITNVKCIPPHLNQNYVNLNVGENKKKNYLSRVHCWDR